MAEHRLTATSLALASTLMFCWAQSAPTSAELAETPIVAAVSAKSVSKEVHNLIGGIRDIAMLREKGMELGFEVRHFPGIGAVLEIDDPMKLEKVKARADMMTRYQEYVRAGKQPLVSDFPKHEREQLEAVMRAMTDDGVSLPSDLSSAVVTIGARTQMRVTSADKEFIVLVHPGRPPSEGNPIEAIEPATRPDGSVIRPPDAGVDDVGTVEFVFNPSVPGGVLRTRLMTKYLEECHRITEEQERRFYDALYQVARHQELTVPPVDARVGSLDDATQAVIREWVRKGGHPPDQIDAFMSRATVTRSNARAFISISYRRPDGTTAGSTGPIYP
ncbi:MAG: hypothetical protein ACK4XJ_08310 [Fimbriimonadaceae bacterium]